MSVEWFSQAVAAAVLILLVGAVAFYTKQPYLYPALGPTAFLQAEFPFHKFSRFQDSVIGHLLGIFAGLGSVILLNVTDLPRLGPEQSTVPAGRIGAAALTVFLVIMLQTFAKVSNPPAAAVGLMFALGFFGNRFSDVLEVMIGVILIASFGVLHRYALTVDRTRRQPARSPENQQNEQRRDSSNRRTEQVENSSREQSHG